MLYGTKSNSLFLAWKGNGEFIGVLDSIPLRGQTFKISSQKNGKAVFHHPVYGNSFYLNDSLYATLNGSNSTALLMMSHHPRFLEREPVAQDTVLPPQDTIFPPQDSTMSIYNTFINGEVRAYPNPTHSKITIDVPPLEFFIRAEIWDASGRKLKTSDRQVVKFGNIPPSIYYLKVFTKHNVYIRKVIKK
jgi:hypothetical protein